MDNKISIRFNIARLNQVKSFLLLSVIWKGNRIQLGSGISVLVKTWDFKKQRVGSKYSDSSKTNNKILKLENRITEEFNRMYYNGNIDKTKIRYMVKKVIDEVVKGISEKPKNQESVLSKFNQMIENRVSGKEKIERTGKPFGESVIKSYKVTMKHLTNFETESRTILTFDKIDETFYSDFIGYLMNINLTNNSIGKNIKNLKILMKWGLKKKYHNNPSFLDFSVWEEEADNIAITNDELKRFEEIDLTGNERLLKVRDLFIIQCLSGLRFSDLSKLEISDFDIKNRIIKLKSTKTKKNLVIPISNRMLKVVSKYIETNLPKISNQKYNDYLKELGKLVELNDVIRITKLRGNDEVIELKSKYELLSSHVGRRTFITVSLGKGVSPDKVMKISGHKKLSNFQKYIKTAEKEAIDDIRKALDNNE